MSHHTLKKSQFKTLVARIEKKRAALAKQRDDLRKLIEEVEALESSATDAHDGLGEAVRCLESAAEDLSRYA